MMSVKQCLKPCHHRHHDFLCPSSSSSSVCEAKPRMPPHSLCHPQFSRQHWPGIPIQNIQCICTIQLQWRDTDTEYCNTAADTELCNYANTAETRDSDNHTGSDTEYWNVREYRTLKSPDTAITQDSEYYNDTEYIILQSLSGQTGSNHLCFPQFKKLPHCIFTCICICACDCICGCIYVCIYVCICGCICACICVRVLQYRDVPDQIRDKLAVFAN